MRRSLIKLPILLGTVMGAVNAMGPKSYLDGETTSFDFVVVGGGTAGLVVATRLAQLNSSLSIAVIEAGVHHVNDSLVNLPSDAGKSYGNGGMPAYDWQFLSNPQAALNGTVVQLARGKMLGGSSGINNLAWTRGAIDEYDAWERLGNPGWNWTTLLPYFMRSESALPPDPSVDAIPGDDGRSLFDANFRGMSGPLQASDDTWYSNLQSDYIESTNGLGVETNPDPYTGNTAGITNMQLSIDRQTGYRSYSANSYYTLETAPDNLRVFTSTRATKINFARSSAALEATSVDVISGNQSITLTANKEVLLTAGTFQSPQLLELSGIGDGSLLASLGVEVLYNLSAVGENLQDQPFAAHDWILKSGVYQTYNTAGYNASFAQEQAELFNRTHTGLLASTNNILSLSPYDTIAENSTVQQIQSHANALSERDFPCPLYRRQYEIQSQWLASGTISQVGIMMLPSGGLLAPPVKGTDYITLLPILFHPFSRGSIHINTSNPLDAPVIDPAYLSDPNDALAIVAAQKWAMNVISEKPLAENVVQPRVPSANVTSDQAILEYTQKNLQTINHPIGTCALAPEEWGGVVDPQLVVYGTSNLRVIDASIIPLAFAAHPQATVYAIAEMAGDIIKGKYGWV